VGLYLCIFDGDEELEGIDLGSYEGFGRFRDAVRDRLEQGKPGSRYPLLMLHSDGDGAWTPEEARLLQDELEAIADAFLRMPPLQFWAAWQRQLAAERGLCPRNLYECFMDVDGEPLIGRMMALCVLAQERQLPILFQ